MIKTRLLKLLADSKKYIVYQVIWKWISLIAQIVIVFQVAALLQAALDGALSVQAVALCALVVVVGVAVRIFAGRAETRASYLASVDVKRVLRDKVYRKLLRLGASYRADVSTSKVVQLAVEGVEQLETYYGLYLSQLFYALLAPLTLFAVLFFVSPMAAGVLLVCVPFIPLSIVLVQKIAGRLFKRYWGSYTQLGDGFLDNLQGLTTLKIYQADEAAAQRMDEEAEDFRKATMRVLTMQLNSTSVMDIGAYGGAALGMVVALSQLFAGNISVASATAIVLLAAEFFLPMRRLGSYFHVAMNGMTASDDIFALLDLPEPESKGVQVPQGPVSFEFRDVSFSYVSERPILRGVSLDLPAGSFVSLVGTSGCGKSTIAGLLAGRNRGYSGSIRVNGVELSQVDEASLHENITLVSCDAHLFKGTVRSNLMLGNPQATDELMNAALASVNLLEFLEEQQGLATPVSEGGSNFSGGQRQRLALARALLHDAPVYVFDEATSSIDVESEEDIMSVIHELAKTKTVLLISHRLANVVDSDVVYLLRDGRILEQGTHTQLMQFDGAYAHLFNAQRELEEYATVSTARMVVEEEGVLA
ncbi:cysteine ABC transporter ATP-binding protein [Denitrobacterium detoxificans]|uniref:ABC-type transport system involved in cytochrome bd biosynthesis, ATPase and permease components n=1 Tax=Denitrobacterium detoxificans TaxID=79604 RepID=A0A172RZG6_9ACTN|nr:ABC transporter ATP-binding protein/permease [Denitrobacterium detoxificans]ANE23045.1 cysteine ABC transporter ATP-binding protein [Denitrobacterium detoxificans]SEO51163.1 ABC-type transport system involved in cytochrome bd biosynthesis, ATPase and permease components [Denitrobacterium detoxificans]